MLYALLKLIVKIALKVFYRNVQVSYKGAVPSEGPLIVVANHPNTFMDPIVIGAILKQPVYFLTNASVFKSPVASWLLRKIHMIPVYRKQDVSGQTPDNRETFKKCFDFLASKGTLLIFPEGTSVNERRLQKLKTGTARIALGAEAEHDFTLGIKILTVGLNYSDARRFRSDLLIQLDSPILVSDFKERYAKDPFDAVTELTELIRERLETHLIITHTQEEDQLVRDIETVYKSQLLQESDLAAKEATNKFLLTKNIVEATRFYAEKEPEKASIIQEKVSSYLRQLERLQLEDEYLRVSPRQQYSLMKGMERVIYLILGFPVYAFGLINNYIPYRIPGLVANLITKDEVYIAPIMMTTGIFSFSICYALQTCLFYTLTGGVGWLTLIYFISLPVSGFWVLYYWNYCVATYRRWSFLAVFRRKEDLIHNIVHRREEIIRLLEEAKAQYLSSVAHR